MNSLELKDKKEQLKRKAQAIINKCKKEVRDLTEEEEQELKQLREEIQKKDEELQELKGRLERLSLDDEKEEEDEREVMEEEDEEEIINKDNKGKRNMKKQFSLVKAIRNIANNQPLDKVSLAVIKEGQKEARKAGVNAQGQIQLPTTEKRGVISVTTEGEDVVATDIFDILTPLRARNVLAKAGAKFMNGLVGNVQVPIMTKSNVTWEGETATAKDGAGTFKHVTLSPRRLTAFIDCSKQMIAQDSIGVENAIREDLVAAINSKLEETILGSAAGTTTQPAGIFKTIEPTAVTDFAGIVNKESEVEDANVIGECVYVLSNKAKAVLRNMPKSAKSTQLVFENGEIDGTKALNTSNVEGKNYVYGDFSNLAIGTWGGVDLTVDPFTKAADGQIRIVVNMYVDCQVLRPEAFTTGTLS